MKLGGSIVHEYCYWYMTITISTTEYNLAVPQINSRNDQCHFDCTSFWFSNNSFCHTVHLLFPIFSRGIPYVEPPLGDLRWAPPVLLDTHWPGYYLDATQFRNFCPQYDHDTKRVSGDEDCLYLNVYTPFLRRELRGPVNYVTSIYPMKLRLQYVFHYCV